MSDTVTTKSERQGLLARLRNGVAGWRRAPVGMNDNSVLGGSRGRARRPDMNSKVRDAARRGWDASAESGVSLSLLAIRIDRFQDLHGVYDRATIEKARKQIGAAIAAGLSETGAAGVGQGDDGFVVVMPNYPFLMARAQAYKIIATVAELRLAHKESHAGVMTVSVGVATANPSGAFDALCVGAAIDALGRAQRRGLGRVETIDLRPKQADRKRA